MRVKKYAGKVFGADLTKDEQKALDIEIKRACREAIDKMERQVDILMLWQLHVQEGWGKKRLERFYKQFSEVYDELRRYYMTDDSKGDGFWIMEKQLKEIDVDVDRLLAEFSKGDHGFENQEHA